MEKYDLVCNKILELDPGIKFVGVSNDKGRLISSQARKKTKLLINEKDGEIIRTEIALIVRMYHEFDTQLGEVRHTIIRREKRDILVFGIGNEILYISCNVKTNLCILVKNITKVINKK